MGKFNKVIFTFHCMPCDITSLCNHEQPKDVKTHCERSPVVYLAFHHKSAITPIANTPATNELLQATKNVTCFYLYTVLLIKET